MKLFRLGGALIFLLAGGLKLCAMPGFAAILGQCGVPAPRVFAFMVPSLELVGCVALIANKHARLAAAGLAVDMVFALLLIGIPGARGARFHGGGFTVGGEWWRVPLEVGLLVGLVWMAGRRD